jgi:hypothetical protein
MRQACHYRRRPNMIARADTSRASGTPICRRRASRASARSILQATNRQTV